MAFTFENLRNLFGGHKSEQAQPSFSAASGRDLEPVHDQPGNVQAPAQNKTGADVKAEQRLIEVKMDEGFRMGASAAVREIAEYLVETRDENFAVWAHDLFRHPERSELLDQQHMAFLEEQNQLAKFLKSYSECHQLSPDVAPALVNILAERSLAHKDAAYQQEAEWRAELEPDNHIENEPGATMHDVLAKNWARDLMKSPDEAERFAERYFHATEAHNKKIEPIEEIFPLAYGRGINFAQLQREVIDEVKTSVKERSYDFSGRDLEKFLEKYHHIDAESPSFLAYQQRQAPSVSTASEEHAAAVEWQRQEDHEAYDGAPESEIDIPSESVAKLLIHQDKTIREEWQQDLESGRHNQHDLETYFAGKIDQHNTLIELAVEANPKLQETLPPQINYEQLRSDIQQHMQQQIQQQPKAQAQAMEMAI